MIHEQRKEDFDTCPQCGHIHYDGGSGLCDWCIEEGPRQPQQAPRCQNCKCVDWCGVCEID